MKLSKLKFSTHITSTTTLIWFRTGRWKDDGSAC